MNSYFKEMIRLADSIADNAHLGQVDKKRLALYISSTTGCF